MTLIMSVVTLTGCGEEEANYSVFWSMSQSEEPESTYILSQLTEVFPISSNTDDESGTEQTGDDAVTDESEQHTREVNSHHTTSESVFNTLTLEMLPGDTRTATFKIWNRIQTPNTTTTFHLNADKKWITFDTKKVKLSTPKASDHQESADETEPSELAHVGSEVNIRSHPTTHSEIIKKTENPTPFPFVSRAIGEDDDKVWYEIQLDEKTTGWVRSDLAQIKSAKDINTQEITDMRAFTTVSCTIALPEDITLPHELTITVTPAKGEKTNLKLKIVEPDWWSVKWVSTGTDNMLINLYESVKKQLSFEITNDSIYSATFEVSSTDEYVSIQDIRPITLKPGESAKPRVWVDIDHVEEERQVEEVITITATKEPRQDDEDKQKLEDQDDTEDTSTKQETKLLTLGLILKTPSLGVVWEETGTDTITVEHYPYMPVIKNFKIVDETGMNLPYRIWYYESFECKGLYPIVIYGSTDRIKIDYSINKRPYYHKTLYVKHKFIMPENSIETEQLKTIGKNSIFAQYTDEIVVSLEEDDNDERKLRCYDLEDASLLWEYPNSDNPEYEQITDTMYLEDISPEFNRVIVQYYNKEDYSYGSDKSTVVVINSNSGKEEWSMEAVDFKSVFGNKDGCLIFVKRNSDSQNEDYSVAYESRKISDGSVIWHHKFESMDSLECGGFKYADSDGAYFALGYPVEGCGGVVTIDSFESKHGEWISHQMLSLLFEESSGYHYGEQIRNQWSEEANHFYDVVFSNHQYGTIIDYISDTLFISGKYICGSEFCDIEPNTMCVFNVINGQLITGCASFDLYHSPQMAIGNINFMSPDYYTTSNPKYYYNPDIKYYNLEGDILELGGYFFEIPSGEHINLPTTYRLQHYTESNGHYYFLDTQTGEIVCISLKE